MSRSVEVTEASVLLRGRAVVWMKQGNYPVAASVLEFLPAQRIRIRTKRGTLAVDRTVKAESLRFQS